MAQILLIEDDAELAQLTAEFLGAHGHQVQVDDGLRASQRVVWEEPQLVILDIELPGDTGFTVCRDVRNAGYPGPILFLTARRSATDELLAFELGGDDFIRKPVDPRILALRVQAALRRRASTRAPVAQRFDDGELRMDPQARRVVGRGEELPLTTGQFDLLWLLVRNAGSVVSRETYYQEIRGIAYNGIDRTYDSRIRELRARLATVGLDERIVTVRGSGYQFTAQ